MDFGRDTRGVSEVIGAILIFGLAIMLLAILQTQAIPAANEDVEFNHNDEVQSQLIDFHQAAAETTRTGDADSTKLDMGLRYPNRLLFFNPPSPAGQLETSDEQTIRIENAESRDDTVGKYFNGDPITLDSRNLSYRANYNEYSAAPVSRYEYGVLYNDHRESQLLVNDGGVVQGREISLLMPAGELHETSPRAISLDPRPVSAPANTIPVTSSAPDNLTLVLPSSMNTALWEDAVDMSHVADITETGSGDVRIEFNADETFSLRMARIGIGDDTPEQSPEYLYPSDGQEVTIPQGQTRVVDVEVRDAYNNPVANQDVTAAVSSGSIGSDGSGPVVVESGSDGAAAVRFNAPSTPQRVMLNATLDDNLNNFDPETDARDVQVELWVTRFEAGVGNDPAITIQDTQYGCGTSGIADYLDDPFGSIFGDDPGAVSVDWRATLDGEQTDLDTVDLRLTDVSTGRVVDTALYAFEEENQASQEKDDATALIDETGSCASNYEIRALVRSTGGKTDIETDSGST